MYHNVYTIVNFIQHLLHSPVHSTPLYPPQDNRTITPLPLGSIASFYYLHHLTIRMFQEKITHTSTLEELLKILCVSCSVH